MIKELEGKTSFFQTDPLLLKYFFDVTPTEHELEKMREVCEPCEKFIEKTGLEKDLRYVPYAFDSPAYLDNYGYYLLIDADRGNWDLIPLGEDVEKIKRTTIYRMLGSLGIEYELRNRKELRKEYDERFKEMNFKPLYDLETNRYFNCLYYVEYGISKFDIYYDGKIPDDIIDYFERRLNSIWWSKEQGVTWYYNRETKRFDCQKKEKSKKLERSKDEKRNH